MTLAPASTSWGRKGSAGDRRIAAGVRLHVCLWVCVGLCVCISMYEVLLLQSCDCQTIHFMSLNESLMMINWSPKTKTTDIYPSLFNTAQAKFWSHHTHMHIQNTHTHTHTHAHTHRNICTAPSSSSWWWCGVKSLFSVTVADSLPAVKMTVVNDQMH